MKIPSEITAGDSISWVDDPSVDNLGNQISAATGWTLKYDLRQSTATNLTLTASSIGEGWLTTLAASDSVNYAAGPLYWQAYAVNGTDRVTLGSGQVNMKMNLAAAANNAEFRTQAQQDLDAVNSAIRAMVSGGAIQEYSIAGRQVRKMTMDQLLVWRDRLVSIVAREKKAQNVANGLGNSSNVFVRFRR